METDWNRLSWQLLRGELSKAGFTYEELAKKLQKAGIDETARSIPTKLSRGTFSFTFFVQCMRVLGRTSVTLDLMVPVRPREPKKEAKSQSPEGETKMKAKKLPGAELEATGDWHQPLKVKPRVRRKAPSK